MYPRRMKGRRDPNTRLVDARKWLLANAPDSAICPCCNRHTKVYRRKLHTTMARALMHMYHYHDADDCYQITRHVNTRYGDTAKLRWWGLIEETDTTGVWRITPLGKKFVEKRVKVLSHAHAYNDECLSLDGKEITIEEALGNKYDYNELMRTRGMTLPQEEDDDD